VVAVADRAVLADVDVRRDFAAGLPGETCNEQPGIPSMSRPSPLVLRSLRFRGLLGEALVGSLFLQLFGLITPLFTQVVIDKVLVHKGWSTLDVLVFGLVTTSAFEILLGGLRAWALPHTNNRIDVELGARLFRHLVSLPASYFGVRRVGDSVARVRELENIRQFLIGQTLTGDAERYRGRHRRHRQRQPHWQHARQRAARLHGQ
jgi:ABC-type bacteriocin/lantibiotic exporter with double-glycine peptidase domain